MSCCNQEHLAALTHIGPVAKSSIEGLSFWVEQISDVTQTGNFKNLWLLLNDFTAKRKKKKKKKLRVSQRNCF